MAHALLALAACAVAIALVPAAGASTRAPKKPRPAASAIPKDQPDRGLVYEGLEPSTATDGCHGRHLFRTKPRGSCTHGPDAAPRGASVGTSVPPATPMVLPPSFTCDGDGTSGFRVQVLYVHADDVTSRYTSYLSSFRRWAADADTIYASSAAETGGTRRLRFVHDGTCTPIIDDVTIPAAADDDFGATEAALAALGYDRPDRKYMLFVDASVYCGIGNIRADDTPGASNENNAGPSYGRSDNGCWTGMVAAHELGHNLGAVQLSAPNTSGGYHCVDEYDVMCYSDSPNYPPMRYLCPDSARDDTRLDCNHDDYYHTAPSAGSYLADHWNVANNVFLVGSATIGSITGTVKRPDGSPVGGITVAIARFPTLSAVTAADGRYTISGVPNGAYRLDAGPCVAVDRPVNVSGATTANLVTATPSDATYQCDAVAPTWTSAGTALALTGDDETQSVSLPFPVRYYGQTYGNLHISTNGHANFAAPSTSLANTPLPDSEQPNAALYPLWDDLVVDESASVRTQTFGTAPNRRFVIEWRNVRFFENADQRISFEIVLGEDNAIAFNYRDVGLGTLERGASATIGIENANGTSAVQGSTDHAALTANHSVVFGARSSLLSIGDASVVEGSSGSRSARFTVSLSEPALTDVRAGYTTFGSDATAGRDFTTKSGTLTIPAGASSTSVSVSVRGDTTVEPKELFSVWLHDLTGAKYGRAVGIGRILDDDPTSGLRVAVGDASVVEGRRGSRAVRMTVSLSAPSTSSVSVSYTTVNGSASSASDYTAKSGSITIPAGGTSAVVSVTVRPDTTVEGDESFTLRISNPVRAVIGRTNGTAKIVNDD
jgi:hypothetical protein